MTWELIATVGGVLALLWTVAFGALAWRLSDLFPRRKEHEALETRVASMEALAMVTADRADEAVRKAEELQRLFDERFVRIIQTQEVVTMSLQETAKTLQDVQLSQMETTTLTRGVVRDIEKLFGLVEKLFDR